jgi:hypothetical protein
MLFMRQKAKDSGRTLQEVQDEQWKIRTRQANDREWIEVPGKNPGTFQWIRAGEITAEPEDPADQPSKETGKPAQAKTAP